MKRATCCITILLAMMIALLAPAQAIAFEQRTGESITVNESISDDLYLFGTNIEVTGNVDGDVVAFGQIIRITGDVTGDVITAGQTITVSGRVGGAVRAAGSDVSIDGAVADDVLGAGNNVRIASNGSVGRDAVLAGSAVTIGGEVKRNVVGAAANLVIAAPVGGDVQADVDDLVIERDGSVAGNLTYYSDSEARVDGDVGGRTRRLPQRYESAEEPSAAAAFFLGVLGWVRGLIGMALFALLVLLVMRPLAERAAWEAWYGRPLLSAGIGFLIFIAALPVALMVFFLGLLIGGWWIAFVLLAVVWLLSMTGIVVAALALGSWIVRATMHRSVHPMLAALLGILLISLAGAIPFVGWLAGFVAMLLGAGALALTLWGKRAPGRPVDQPVAEPYAAPSTQPFPPPVPPQPPTGYEPPPGSGPMP